MTFRSLDCHHAARGFICVGLVGLAGCGHDAQRTFDDTRVTNIADSESKPSVSMPLIVAHRGASRDAPENTLPAFELAWQQGADAIEGDFHLTADGNIVCIHDRNTKNVSGKAYEVKDTPTETLRSLDVGARHGRDFEGTGIPMLAEVLKTVPPRKKIYIEIKCGVEIIDPLLDQLKASNLTNEQVIVISFHRDVIRDMKAKAPAYKAYWLTSTKKDKAGQISPSLESVLETLRDIDADGVSTSKAEVDELFINGIRSGGYEYHVWTVDDVETAKRFRKWGAASITTNVPQLIRTSLKSENVP